MTERVLVLGAGVAGLFTALALSPGDREIWMPQSSASKSTAVLCSSSLSPYPSSNRNVSSSASSPSRPLRRNCQWTAFTAAAMAWKSCPW